MTPANATPVAAAKWTPEKQLEALAMLEELETEMTEAIQIYFPGATASVVHIDWNWRPDEPKE
jgi:hypothetical protein